MYDTTIKNGCAGTGEVHPLFKWVDMPQRYNHPCGRQKQSGNFFVIFLQNTKYNNIVDNFGLYDRGESVGGEIKLFNLHEYCVFSLSSIFIN